MNKECDNSEVDGNQFQLITFLSKCGFREMDKRNRRRPSKARCDECQVVLL